LTAQAWGPGADFALETAPALVGADDEVSRFAPLDPTVARLNRELPGLRIGAAHNALEILVPTILEQKVTGKEARRSYEQIVRTYGQPAPGPGELWIPPAPDEVAGIPSWSWHRFGVERRRAETVRRVCQSGKRIQSLVETHPAEEVHRRLLSLSGIGPWTAAYTTLLAMGDADAVLVGDFHIPHLVSYTLAGEARGSDARMLELLEPYRGHRGRVIRLIEAGGARPERRAPRKALREIAAI
jgi:3-methyladenine DNA glycosylase/8-oxoguanine DNA glycosylase